jgi:ABC-type uncharacterized transport system substrate-binding protein
MRRRQFIALAGITCAAWAVPLRAERAGKPYRIGYLALTPGEDATLMKTLLQRLHELGYTERDIIVDYRSADGQPKRLPALAAELVKAEPDVLVAGFGTLAAQAAKAATVTVPIVFTTVGDPLGAGVVPSLSRPGGNITGLTDQAKDVEGKRLQILQELLPGKRHMAAFLNPATPFARLALEEAKTAAKSAQLELDVVEVSTPHQVAERFESAVTAGAAGMLIFEDPLIYSMRRKIAELAAQFRLPAIYVYKESVEAGGLVSYGPDRPQIYRRAAEYVDKILRGAKPADLAVEQPTKFDLVINLKAAKALGLAVPVSLLATADQVIE